MVGGIVMRFKMGDIIENLWASEENPRRKIIFVYNHDFLCPGCLWFDNGVSIARLTREEIQRWENDTEHYKVIGHCDIEQFVKEHLNEKEIVMSIEKAREYEANIGWQEYSLTEIDESFKAGAEWMLERIVRWLKDNAQRYYCRASQADNCWYDDDALIIELKKIMEE